MIYTFHLKTVSEVFAGGADTQDAELRPSAFRGPLRFWFRTMMGKIVGNDLKSLEQLEALVFGETDAVSPFQLRVNPPLGDLTRGILTRTRYFIGYNYLAFSLKERMCLPQNTQFEVSLRFRRPDPLLQEVVLGTFWLLLNYGGIGSRTRRSFGALCADKVEGEIPLKFAPPEVFSLVEHYQEGLAAVQQAFEKFAQKHRRTVPQYTSPLFTTFHHWSGRIILPDQDSVFEAQECLGRILRGFRNGKLAGMAPWNFRPEDLQRNTRTQDYKDVISPFLGNKPIPVPNLTNDALGLPIVFFSSSRQQQERDAKGLAQRKGTRYKKGPWTATTQWKLPPDAEWQDRRRASPLFLRPLKISNGRYAALIAAFPCQFLPTNGSGQNAEQRLKPGGPQPDQARHHNPLAVQVCIQKDVEKVVGSLFKQVDDHFGKDSLRL